MSKTRHYRMHHSEIREIVRRIEALLDVEQIAADAAPVAAIVRELFGKLHVHLQIEDAWLYPKMMTQSDPAVRLAAERFQREMGGLKEDFDAYRHQWRGPTEIAREPARFVAETTSVLAALKLRIAREDQELYWLYDETATDEPPMSP